VHADLNARNILIREDGAVFLIDFDRARFREGAEQAFSANLKRLKRSLHKFWPDKSGDKDREAWTHLLKGYGY
jgi:3-deoxy-D-manno-octulosonic acid kinase